MQKTQNFTQGPIFAPLIFFAFPVLLAMLFQTMYGAVDLLVVGQFGTSADVSAVATGSQLMQSVTFAISGVAMGLTVFVGKLIGAGQEEEAGKAVGSGICLFAFLAVMATVLMLLNTSRLTRLMRAPDRAVRPTMKYIRICSAGTVFIVAYNLVGSIFRGIGDSKIPLLTVVIACVCNIAGDLILVAGLRMGAAGAATATVAAQAISVMLSLIIIRKRELPFTFSAKYIRPVARYIKNILKLGVPIALQDLLVSFSFLAITAIVNNLGLIASAGVGVAEKLCGFLMLVPSAFSSSISAFVAQNTGARKPERSVKALKYSIITSLIAGLIMCYFTFFHGSVLSGLFAKDARVIAASADYLKAYAIDCVLTAFLFCFTGYFSGIGSTTFVMLQGIVGAFCVRLPVSRFMSRLTPPRLFMIGLATPASSLVQIILCMGYFLLLQRKTGRSAVE